MQFVQPPLSFTLLIGTLHNASSQYGWIILRKKEAARFKYCLGWVHLSHTNRRLRQICLNSPALWAELVVSLPTGSPMDMITLLVRARQVPLSFDLSIPPPNTRAFPSNPKSDKTYIAKCAIVTQHLDHAAICKLAYLDGFPQIDWRPVFANRTLDKLLYLTLECTSTGLQKFMPITAPNLVELCILGLLFPIVTTHMASLRKLDVRFFGHLAEGIDGCGQVLDLLRHTPLLEDLTLTFADATPHAATLFQERVTLARLRKALIKMPGQSDTYSIWSKLETPESVSVQFYLTPNYNNADPTSAFHAARTQLRYAAHTSVRLLRVAEQFAFSVYANNNAKEGVTFAWPNPSEEFVGRVISAVPSLVVAANIKQLSVPSSIAVVDESILSGFFTALSAVSRLTYENEPSMNDLDVPHVLDMIKATPSLLPSLIILAVAYDMTPEKLPVQPGPFRKYWIAIASLLGRRDDDGKPIRFLGILGARPANEDGVTIEAEALTVAGGFVEEIIEGRN